jgi:hypothetical protein
MSLTDKVIEELRNDTYAGGLVDRDEAAELARDLSQLTASADAPFGAQKMLAYAVACEVVALAIAKFGLRYLVRFADVAAVAVFGIIFLFLIGFFGAFAAYKLYKEYIAPDSDAPANDEAMSPLADYNNSQSDMAIYFLSIAGGVANVVLLFVLLTI